MARRAASTEPVPERSENVPDMSVRTPNFTGPSATCADAAAVQRTAPANAAATVFISFLPSRFEFVLPRRAYHLMELIDRFRVHEGRGIAELLASQHCA